MGNVSRCQLPVSVAEPTCLGAADCSSKTIWRRRALMNRTVAQVGRVPATAYRAATATISFRRERLFPTRGIRCANLQSVDCRIVHIRSRKPRDRDTRAATHSTLPVAIATRLPAVIRTHKAGLLELHQVSYPQTTSWQVVGPKSLCL